MKELDLEELLDYKILLKCDQKISNERLAKRLVECGISKNMDEAIFRVNDNDNVNA
jgi:hypothetical protein